MNWQHQEGQAVRLYKSKQQVSLRSANYTIFKHFAPICGIWDRHKSHIESKVFSHMNLQKLDQIVCDASCLSMCQLSPLAANGEILNSSTERPWFITPVEQYMPRPRCQHCSTLCIPVVGRKNNWSDSKRCTEDAMIDGDWSGNHVSNAMKTPSMEELKHCIALCL